MNNVDKEYLSLLSDVMENGVEKDTRAGRVKSLFGKQLRFDLKEGFPLLTTKKVFTKGVIHELLWFLQHSCNSHGSMNIEYLVRNKVYIWNDDAYRWYKEWIEKNIVNPANMDYGFFVCTYDDEKGGRPSFEYWIEGEKRKEDLEWLINLTKEEFIDLVLQRVEIRTNMEYSYVGQKIYRFGDLGPVYGAQWRSYGYRSYRKLDQIQNIIDTLKTNPNDRRMLCVAYNPSFIRDMALPPCHVMFQFYTRELSNKERMRIFNERYMKGQIPKKWDDWFHEYSKEYINNDADVPMPNDGSNYDIADIPKYGLSCMWTQRSCDLFLGVPFNIASYALLTHMIAKVVNMVPDELIGSLGDCHIYEAHFDAVKEQLSREGNENLPKLEIEGNHIMVEDFKFEDFKIMGYEPDPPIKAPLLVG